MHQLEKLYPILCAHAPSDVAEFMRSILRTMPGRNLSGQYSVAIQLPEMSLVLRAAEVNAVSGAMLSLSANASEWSVEMQHGVRQQEQVAEASSFVGIAPHLGAVGLVKRLLARPANALDLLGLEAWCAPVPEESRSAIISLIHSSPDQATLRRVLWVLPSIGISLSDDDRPRLLELAGSQDALARLLVLRVAVLSRDERLGRGIVDLGVATTPGMHPWEEWWMTLALARFGRHLAFEDLAKRLRPSGLAVAIQERGDLKEELELYARCLDQEWQRIVSAEDPEIQRLPEIEIDGTPGNLGTLPELYEPERPSVVRLNRSGSCTSGPPADPGLELKKMFSPEHFEEQVRQLNVDRHRKTEAILAAWRTNAFHWYGRTFRFHTIDLLYTLAPSLVEAWVKPAMSDSPTGAAVRVRTGGLLEPACRVLLKRNPESGLRLWRLLRKRDDSPLVFNTTDIAFSANSTEGQTARNILLDECWNDSQLARLAFTCDKWKRHEWLDVTVQELISADRLWKRAKGLTLASFSNVTSPRFEEIVSTAAIAQTWVEQSLRQLRQNVRKNHVARHWYRVFLNSDDDDAAWGALQIVLSHADERFLNWREEIESESANIEITERRLRFLQMRWSSGRAIQHEINRDKDHRERLFGIKIQPGEIAPFMMPHE
jgi:hypothetical protein